MYLNLVLSGPKCVHLFPSSFYRCQIVPFSTTLVSVVVKAVLHFLGLLDHFWKACFIIYLLCYLFSQYQDLEMKLKKFNAN